MTQYVAFDDKTEVLGAIFSAYALALGPDAQVLLEKHGVENFDPDGWYPQQKLLDVLNDASEGDMKAMFDLVRSGMKIPEISLTRVDFREFDKLMVATYGEYNPYIRLVAAFTSELPMSFPSIHRNGYAGKYNVTRTGPTTVDVRVETPYPCDIDYGLIWGDIRTFFGSKLDFVVRHAQGDCRQKGAEACVYHIEWAAKGSMA